MQTLKERNGETARLTVEDVKEQLKELTRPSEFS